MTKMFDYQRMISRRSVVRGVAAAGVTGLVSAAVPGAVRSSFGNAGTVTRRGATSLAGDAGALAALEAAVGEMQARSKADPSDPKGWMTVANAHRDFCAIPSGAANQIHFCWWFLSWHRAYIAVTERKLREIAGDPSIAYPYWNWSAERKIPAIFSRPGSPLAAAVRSTPDRGLQDPEVDYFPDDPVKAPLVVAALGATFFEAKVKAEIARSFGGIARPNAAGDFGNNRLEGVPHGPVHNYVGGDMSDFATAGRDPIFFAHHGNLDRLWEIWRQDPKRKATEPTGDDFLKHEFPFTWLDGTTVTVAVSDTLDTTKLGYVYDTLEVVPPQVAIMAVSDQAGAQAQLAPIAREEISVPRPTLTATVGRPNYVLTIAGVMPPPRPLTVGVYIKAKADTGPGHGVAVGSFAAVLNGGEVGFVDPQQTFDVSEALERLGTSDVTVSVVPFALGAEPRAYEPLRYEAMKIEIESGPRAP